MNRRDFEEAYLVADGVEVLWMDNPNDAQENTDMDEQYGKAVASGRPPVVRLWRSGFADGLSLSRRDVAGERGMAALEQTRNEGLEVVIRQTGGTAVPQGEGVFHVSWILPRTSQTVTTDAYFRLLVKPIIAWLRELGLEAATGALPGSYCDGTYNILVENRKLVGTAQAWRGGLAGTGSRHPGYILAHASITTEVDFEAARLWINRFYERAGKDYRMEADTSISLVQTLPSIFAGVGKKGRNEAALSSLKDFLCAWLPQRGVKVLGDSV